MTTIVDQLSRHARHAASRTALVIGADRWSYGRLEREGDACARGLVHRGVRAGDRVVLALAPSVETFAALIGVWKLGAVPAWIDPRSGPRAVARFVEQVSPRVALAPWWLHGLRVATRTRFETVELGISAGRRWGGGSTLARRGDGDPIRPHAVEGDEWLIHPNPEPQRAPVIWCRGQLASRARAMADALTTESLRVVHTDPVLALLDLCLGRTVILTGDADPGELVDAVRDHAAEAAVTSVARWEDAAAFCDDERIALPSLRAVVAVGSTGVGPVWLRRLQRVLPPTCRVWFAFGFPEAFPVAFLDLRDAIDRTWEQTVRGAGWCAGKPTSGAHVRIAVPSEHQIPHWSDRFDLALGDVGEIVVDDGVASRRYTTSNANQRTKISFGARTLHRTGRLGYLDPRGNLWVCGSLGRRLLLADGRWISPESIEAMFDDHPWVARTTLVQLDEAQLVLCVEMKHPHGFDPRIERKIRELAAGTEIAKYLARIVPIRELPIERGVLG